MISIVVRRECKLCPGSHLSVARCTELQRRPCDYPTEHHRPKWRFIMEVRLG